MSKAIDLSHIYNLRNDFTIIGLTGQIGSGCSEVAEQFVKGFGDGKDYENPFDIGLNETKDSFKHNSYRKYRIIYDYAKENFKGYTLIKYKDVITIFLLQNTFESFVEFLKSAELKKEFSKMKIEVDFQNEISKIASLKSSFDELAEKYKSINVPNIKDNNNWEGLFEFFFNTKFTELNKNLHGILSESSLLKRNKTLQVIGTNIRKSGNPYSSDETSADNIFTVVELINNIIKCHGEHRKKNSSERNQIVIDSLRNPIEIMFFKQRFAAFYTVAINRDDDIRISKLIGKYTLDSKNSRDIFWQEEYKGGGDSEFYKANIEACIQQADIHISFLEDEEVKRKNSQLNPEKKKNSVADFTSPFFSWRMQLLKYVSLISHPGIVTPSPEERCMQLAYTAKHNSGCISRHVGAAITDESYSVKAIGWNNTPSGQVPCVLRNASDLLNHTNDIYAFTDYEKQDEEFNKAFRENFESQISEQQNNLKGRNVCFCFKDIKNSCSEGKNQVHTRSLHAEESAFLQIAKYGGVGIENGKLFTTASPCELCAKKAYQLGIKVIYYIDPYPGISLKHILSTGGNPIEVRLFNGAIGNAYHWLYDPIMPFKNELNLLLGNKFKDFASQQKDKADKYEKENTEVKNENEELKKQLEELKGKLQKSENSK